MSYQSVIAIMDRGKARTAIQAVNQTGMHAGALLTGRGIGLHENQRILNIAVEPEKDILLLISKQIYTEDIIQSINSSVNIIAPGQGLLVSMKVNRVHGIN